MRLPVLYTVFCLLVVTGFGYTRLRGLDLGAAGGTTGRPHSSSSSSSSSSGGGFFGASSSHK